MPQCTVYVSHRSGTGASAVRVSGSVGGLSGVSRAAKTDQDGKAILEWSNSGPLRHIYINGKEHRGTYASGGTYTFQL